MVILNFIRDFVYTHQYSNIQLIQQEQRIVPLWQYQKIYNNN